MKFKIEQSSEKINSAGGMALVGALLDKSGLNEAVDAIQTGKGRPIYCNSLIIRRWYGRLPPAGCKEQRREIKLSLRCT